MTHNKPSTSTSRRVYCVGALPSIRWHTEASAPMPPQVLVPLHLSPLSGHLVGWGVCHIWHVNEDSPSTGHSTIFSVFCIVKVRLAAGFAVFRDSQTIRCRVSSDNNNRILVVIIVQRIILKVYAVQRTVARPLIRDVHPPSHYQLVITGDSFYRGNRPCPSNYFC